MNANNDWWIDDRVNLTSLCDAAGWHLATAREALLSSGESCEDADAFVAFAFDGRATTSSGYVDGLSEDRWNRLTMKTTQPLEREWLIWLLRDELLANYPDAGGDLPGGWRVLASETAGYYERGEDVPRSHRDAASVATRAANARIPASVATRAANARVMTSALAAIDAADDPAAAFRRMAEALVLIADLAPITGLDARILSAIEDGFKLDMNQYHTCATTHCRAGFAVIIHPQGRQLEEMFGPRLAGAAIYLASTGAIPDFFASDEEAMASIREGAGL